MCAVRRRGSVWYVDIYNGKQRIVRKIGPTKKEALDVEAKMKTDIREGKFFGGQSLGPPPTFNQLLAKYLYSSVIKRSYKTEYFLLQPAQQHFGPRVITDIDAADVEEYRLRRVKTPIKGGGKRSNATVNREIEVIRRMFNKAIAWKLARYNPAAGLKPLNETRGRTRYLELAEASSLVKHADPALRPVLAVALDTGMRKGEILAMKWEDVDFTRGVIFIPDSKNGKSRYVPMSFSLQRLLMQIKEDAKPMQDYHVFPSKVSVSYAFRVACKKAGLSGVRFHDLRHTFITHALDRGAEMFVVGKIVGHSNQTMTERYAHLVKGREHDVVKSLPKWGEFVE